MHTSRHTSRGGGNIEVIYLFESAFVAVVGRSGKTTVSGVPMQRGEAHRRSWPRGLPLTPGTAWDLAR